MCNTCGNFDEWKSYETHFKVQLLSLFSSFNFMLPPLSFFSSIEAPSPIFLSKALSWWQSSFFHGLFPSGWRLPSPLLLYLPLHLHGGKSPLKNLIKAQRSSLHGSSTSKLPSSSNQSTRALSRCSLNLHSLFFLPTPHIWFFRGKHHN